MILLLRTLDIGHLFIYDIESTIRLNCESFQILCSGINTQNIAGKMVKHMTGIYDKMKVQREAEIAFKRIKNYIRVTPLDRAFFFENLDDTHVYLKLENIQVTGSFKLRGAFNKLLSLSEKDRQKGIITASTGNHGAAFLYASEILNTTGVVCVPENISPAKLKGLKMYGKGREELIFRGNDVEETESYARELSKKQEKEFVSPYNDSQVIGGQATIGIEILEQLPSADVVFVPVGGGGLMSGIAGYLKCKNPEIKIIGCQPQHSPVMYESVKAGRLIQMESLPTLADGTAGGIEEGSITFEICRDCVDEFIMVSESEIKEAILLVLEKYHMLIEGAAALSVASYIKTKDTYKGKNVVLIISGKKISLEQLKEIIC
jgi:threonine dehydratase